MMLHPLDGLVIGVAVAAFLWLGYRGRRSSSAQEQPSAEYILAGRSLTAPLFAASLIATWYGAVLGAGEFITRHGVVMILCFGIPYYIVAAVYAAALARRIRSSEAVSIPDQLRRTYGRHAGYLAAAMILVIAIPAPYILTLGLVLTSITGYPLEWSIVLGAVLSLAIVARGGLRSDVYANVGQVIVMYAGFVILVVASVMDVGSMATMWNMLPSTHRSLPGTMEWSAVAVWFLIALQTFIDPNFHVRAAAARTSSVARTGLLWSIAGWIVFDGLQLLAGLYAIAKLPQSDPAALYLDMAAVVLPPGLLGVFVASILAAVMSTLDGYALVSATTIGHDLLDSIRGGHQRRSSLLFGLVVTGVIGSAIAMLIPSIIELLLYAASIAVPALMLPLLNSYRGQQGTTHACYASHRILLWMFVPAVVAVGAMMTSVALAPPMLLGLLASVLLMPYALRTPRRPSHGLEPHQPAPSASYGAGGTADSC